MELIAKAARGTQDTLPQDSYKVQYLEQAMRETAESFGYREIRVPVFEHTELFQRSVGDTTDVVQKEMYTFLDKGGRSITLRPEGTAGAARAFLEHGLYNEPLPQKAFYLLSCYRYEKPQAGRLREFHQFGVECFGAAEPAADAEVIGLAATLLDYLGVMDLSLRINSIGCPNCRTAYHDALRAYFTKYQDGLCETCRNRLARNPMRILDCKSPVCAEIAAGAPTVLDYICDDCQTHFEGVQQYLHTMEIPFTVDPHIVRGLDYYTRTVFEFVSDAIGAQGTICGGGRYDGLMEELGGPHIPSLGFGMGIERLLALMETQQAPFPEQNRCDIFIGSAGSRATLEAMRLAHSFRQEGMSAQTDLAGRSVKAQMKYANKLQARFTLVLGDNELDSGTATLKNMEDGTTQEVSLATFADDFMGIAVQETVKNLEDLFAEDQESETDS